MFIYWSSCYSYFIKASKSILKIHAHKIRPKQSNNFYKFGNDKQIAIGSINMRIPIVKTEMSTTTVDIVNAYVPFLIGLDFLDKHKMHINNVNNSLLCHTLDLYITLIRKNKHIDQEWGKNNILYTIQELLKLHCNSHIHLQKNYLIC